LVQDAAARGLSAQDGVAGQFGPVVTDEYPELATHGDQAIEFTRNPATGERGVGRA